MLSTTSKLKLIKNNYPQFNFVSSDDFVWSPNNKTIYYDAKDNHFIELLLHELSHAILGHSSYNRDIQLVAMERQAWEQATRLALDYKITIKESFIESTLDSYRDWIHDRSTCPKCNATGMQTEKNKYKCPNCDYGWRVNEARTCALRRYGIK